MTKRRVTCSAFGCTKYRTRDEQPGTREVWLCRDHWAAIPKPMRRVVSRAFRQAKGKSNPARSWRLWNRCVREANRNIGLS